MRRGLRVGEETDEAPFRPASSRAHQFLLGAGVAMIRPWIAY